MKLERKTRVFYKMCGLFICLGKAYQHKANGFGS